MSGDAFIDTVSVSSTQAVKCLRFVRKIYQSTILIRPVEGRWFFFYISALGFPLEPCYPVPGTSGTMELEPGN